jgi:hypothetical protein
MICIIKVTQKHIDNGIPCRSGECPIALAMQEFFPKYNIWASYGWIRFWPLDIIYPKQDVLLAEIVTPPIVGRFIGQFDGNNSVEPFSFQLEVPDELCQNLV